MRRRSRIERGLLSAALIVLIFSPLAEAGPDPFKTYRVLGEDGSIFEWSSGGTVLRRAASPLAFTDLGGSVKDLTSFAAGTRLVVLIPNPDDAGKGRKRREGLAIVYDTSRPIPTEMHRIPLEGDGYGVAAAPDGRRCYVLAARPEPARGGPRFWIHGLDPESGKVASTTLLDRPGTGLIVAPDGTRLFVSFEDRIQSYTTKPLFTSWHYRSPGFNAGLYFPPGGDVLYAIRTGGIAIFDPDIILTRNRNTPRDETDDSTGMIGLPLVPSAMLFSAGRQSAAALGDGTVAFIDLATGAVLPSSDQPAVLKEAALLQPLQFLPAGDLIVGLFPAGITTAIPAPEPLPILPAASGESPPETAATLAAAGEESEAGDPASPRHPDPPVESPGGTDVGTNIAAVSDAPAGDAAVGDAATDDTAVGSAPVGNSAASDAAAGEAGGAGTAGASPEARSAAATADTSPEPDPGAAATTATVPPTGGTPSSAGTATTQLTPATGDAPDADIPPPLEPPRAAELAAPIVASTPPEAAEPEPTPQPAPEPRPAPAAGLSLSGQLSGERALVVALVLYGPGSIIREHARVAPAADGSFHIPLPPPGTYRLVPIGEASRPVAANPNFHTITVQAGRECANLDFSIEKGP